MGMRRQDEEKFRVFENKILRKVAGPVRDPETESGWRRRTNDELFEATGQDVVAFIRSRRLEWAGHVSRMGKQQLPRMALFAQGKGKRPRGRPRKRWQDLVKRDAGADWTEAAQHRQQWNKVVEAVRRKPTTTPRS